MGVERISQPFSGMRYNFGTNFTGSPCTTRLQKFCRDTLLLNCSCTAAVVKQSYYKQSYYMLYGLGRGTHLHWLLRLGRTRSSHRVVCEDRDSAHRARRARAQGPLAGGAMGEEGRAEDQPPQSHTPVPETSEGEKGSAGPTADQAPQDQAQQSTFAAPFDEDAWFAQEAERLRQLNQNKAQEVRGCPPALLCSATHAWDRARALPRALHMLAARTRPVSSTCCAAYLAPRRAIAARYARCSGGLAVESSLAPGARARRQTGATLHATGCGFHERDSVGECWQRKSGSCACVHPTQTDYSMRTCRSSSKTSDWRRCQQWSAARSRTALRHSSLARPPMSTPRLTPSSPRFRR